MNGHVIDERYGKSLRIRRRKDFLALQKRGIRVNLRDFLVIFSSNVGVRKIGITVSSRVGCAVQRNRLKRLIRELWRRQTSYFPEGFEYIIIAKNSARDLCFSDLKRQFSLLVEKIGTER